MIDYKKIIEGMKCGERGEPVFSNLDFVIMREALERAKEMQENLLGSKPLSSELPTVSKPSRLTTDRNDPRLTKGLDTGPVPQAEVYLVLSQYELDKGFVRPVRTSYRHVGSQPKRPLRSLTTEEIERYGQYGYVAFEEYPEADLPVTGKFWTQQALDAKGCGTVTTMGMTLSETYAREPTFYGRTYCCGCSKHLPVDEFVWDDDNERVGS